MKHPPSETKYKETKPLTSAEYQSNIVPISYKEYIQQVVNKESNGNKFLRNSVRYVI